MSVFAFHDAYPEAGDFSMDESDSRQADFDIDSDASDADLLELKQELNKGAKSGSATVQPECYCDGLDFDLVCFVELSEIRSDFAASDFDRAVMYGGAGTARRI